MRKRLNSYCVKSKLIFVLDVDNAGLISDVTDLYADVCLPWIPTWAIQTWASTMQDGTAPSFEDVNSHFLAVSSARAYLLMGKPTRISRSQSMCRHAKLCSLARPRPPDHTKWAKNRKGQLTFTLPIYLVTIVLRLDVLALSYHPVRQTRTTWLSATTTSPFFAVFKTSTGPTWSTVSKSNSPLWNAMYARSISTRILQYTLHNSHAELNLG